jgi:hypothetical protein
MATVTTWKDKWACHCPNCNNVFDLIWLDGTNYLGECLLRCPVCLNEFYATGKTFLSEAVDHGTVIDTPDEMLESLNDKARREARE